jgi:hypothetical protein
LSLNDTTHHALYATPHQSKTDPVASAVRAQGALSALSEALAFLGREGELLGLVGLAKLDFRLNIFGLVGLHWLRLLGLGLFRVFGKVVLKPRRPTFQALGHGLALSLNAAGLI